MPAVHMAWPGLTDSPGTATEARPSIIIMHRSCATQRTASAAPKSGIQVATGGLKPGHLPRQLSQAAAYKLFYRYSGAILGFDRGDETCR
jgi:hypothetical protein